MKKCPVRNRQESPAFGKRFSALGLQRVLGLMFLVFVSKLFLHFIPMGPMPAGLAEQFMGVLMAAHYMYPVGAIMVLSEILLLVNR